MTDNATVMAVNAPSTIRSLVLAAASSRCVRIVSSEAHPIVNTAKPDGCKGSSLDPVSQRVTCSAVTIAIAGRTTSCTRSTLDLVLTAAG